MIKLNLTICGTITKAAQIKTNKEGKQFLSYEISVVIPSKNGQDKTIIVSVAQDASLSKDIANYALNKRAEIKGTGYTHKMGDNLFWNISCETINFMSPGEKDSFKGTIEFRGTVGKKILSGKDKKEKPYYCFSAFHTEKNDETFEYTWLHFMHFGEEKPEWLKEKSHVSVEGDIELSVFKERLDVNCYVKKITKWEKQPYDPNH